MCSDNPSGHLFAGGRRNYYYALIEIPLLVTTIVAGEFCHQQTPSILSIIQMPLREPKTRSFYQQIHPDVEWTRNVHWKFSYSLQKGYRIRISLSTCPIATYLKSPSHDKHYYPHIQISAKCSHSLLSML